jgi:hypothetical protein
MTHRLIRRRSLCSIHQSIHILFRLSVSNVNMVIVLSSEELSTFCRLWTESSFPFSLPKTQASLTPSTTLPLCIVHLNFFYVSFYTLHSDVSNSTCFRRIHSLHLSHFLISFQFPRFQPVQPAVGQRRRKAISLIYLRKQRLDIQYAVTKN